MENYTLINKYRILSGELKKGMYIKAIPINNLNCILSGKIVNIDIISNLYYKTLITIQIYCKSNIKFIKFHPIKYDIYYKIFQHKKTKKEILIDFLKNLDQLNKNDFINKNDIKNIILHNHN
jgi:hypothetical protein